MDFSHVPLTSKTDEHVIVCGRTRDLNFGVNLQHVSFLNFGDGPADDLRHEPRIHEFVGDCDPQNTAEVVESAAPSTHP